MLVRRRLSRIFYRRRFFDYPLKLNARTLRNLGMLDTLRIGASYARAQLMPRAPEASLEDFLVNRFGQRLYRTFFKDYTEKVWGVPCREISAEWGAQRIKGLSVSKALANAIAGPFRSRADTRQKGTETSLIERFLYPKFGPGQMWEEVARRIEARGGTVHLNHRIVGLEHDGTVITAAQVRDPQGSVHRIACDQFISTMPVQELTRYLDPQDDSVRQIADGLPYRDFMTAGLLLRRMSALKSPSPGVGDNGMPPDNWIYIQEPDVRIGRLQVFNNWSPAHGGGPADDLAGARVFLRARGRSLVLDDAALLGVRRPRARTIGMIRAGDVLDGTVVRVPKAYPAYFGAYRDFAKLREYLDRFANLYPVGRNGMHRYNNQDHSMLTANGAVTAILNGGDGKAAIWAINEEDDYHEESAGEVEKLTPEHGVVD